MDVADGTNTGVTVAGLVGISPFNFPLSFRLEAQYTRLGLNDERRTQVGRSAYVIAQGAANIFSGVGNVVLAVPAADSFRPYLIGGAGVYRLSSNIDLAYLDGTPVANGAPPEGETRFGLNGGAGFELPIGSVRSFVEARFHGVFTGGEGADFIPISVGVKF